MSSGVFARQCAAQYITQMSNPLFPTPLVSVPWLAAHLGDPRLRIVDASMYLPAAGRDALAEYHAAHIDGAVFADLGWLSDPAAPFPHTLLHAVAFGQRMGALGISNDHHVVVYDTSGQNFSAPRLWWMLRTFGHDHVSVLDGGLKKWQNDGHAVTAESTPVVPQTFHAQLTDDRVRDLATIRNNLSTHAEHVVDARSPGRFSATEPEPRAGVRGGHIPGSRNVHYATLVNDDGTLRSASELRAIITAAGIVIERPIVASCGTGVTACAVVLALDVLGVHDTAVFDGSWTEWGSALDTPVSTGSD